MYIESDLGYEIILGCFAPSGMDEDTPNPPGGKLDICLLFRHICFNIYNIYIYIYKDMHIRLYMYIYIICIHYYMYMHI